MLPQIYPTDNSGQNRPLIRTFNGRQGRLSETRLKILEELVPNFAITQVNSKQDLRQVFKSDQVYVDFGCGMGQHTKDLLLAGKSVLAIDVHTAGICDLAAFATERQLDTLRIFHGDGVQFFTHAIQPETVSRVDVYFPDPWPKARHGKRRLFTAEFLNLVHKVLEPAGQLLLVTDDDNYALQAQEVISDTKLFTQIEFPEEITLTSFHKRALHYGHKIHAFALLKK